MKQMSILRRQELLHGNYHGIVRAKISLLEAQLSAEGSRENLRKSDLLNNLNTEEFEKHFFFFFAKVFAECTGTFSWGSQTHLGSFPLRFFSRFPLQILAIDFHATHQILWCRAATLIKLSLSLVTDGITLPLRQLPQISWLMSTWKCLLITLFQWFRDQSGIVKSYPVKKTSPEKLLDHLNKLRWCHEIRSVVWSFGSDAHTGGSIWPRSCPHPTFHEEFFRWTKSLYHRS